MVNLARNLSRVKTWYENGTTSTNSLYHGFNDGLQTTGLGMQPLFSHIYVPYTATTSNGTATTQQWVDIGYNAHTIAQIYRDYYGLNFLITPYTDIDSDTNKSADLARRINSVVRANYYKYLKNIELMGYYYNPLWNVDGQEIFSYADFDHYDATTKIDHTITTNGLTSERQVTTYDSQTYRNAEKDTESGATKDEFTVTRTRTLSDGIYVPADALGNAFENQAPDNYHTEKKIRTGNIGVTTSAQLIKGERENLKFSIIEEFFKDLNKQILVGIY